MTKLNHAFILSMAICWLLGCSPASKSDSTQVRIISAKEIVVLDSDADYDAIVIEDDRIKDLGRFEDLENQYPGAPVDHTFQDKVIVPGFIEHHIHPFLSALTMNAEIISIERWDLPGNQSIAYRDRKGYLDRLRQVEKHMEEDLPLITWGFHQYFHGDLSRDDLDRISSQRPILVLHRSYHEVILNTPALNFFGINPEFIRTLDDEAKAYADYEAGHFSEQGMLSVFPRLMSQLGRPEYLLSGLQLTENYLHQKGVTLVSNPGAWLAKSIQDAKNFVLGDEDTPFRSYFFPSALGLAEIYPVADLVKQSEALLSWGQGKVEYLPNRIKLFTDGAMYSQNMVLSDGYTDGHEGAWLMKEDLFRSAFQVFWDANYQIHIHQNGDAALDLILEVLKSNLIRNPRKDHRTTVVHFGVTRVDQIRELKLLGVLVSANPYYVTALSDLYSRKGLGPERAGEMVRLGDVDRAGIIFGLHSDMPMAPASPLLLMHSAVNRINFADDISGPSQRISAESALRAVTSSAAYILGLEDDVGSISRGKLANLTILSENPLTIDSKAIQDIEVIGTIVEGRYFPVYEEDISLGSE